MIESEDEMTYTADAITTDALVNDARASEARFLYAMGYVDADMLELFAEAEDVKDDIACMAAFDRQHVVGSQTCSCGQDSVTCQIDGELVCGNATTWNDPLGNVCAKHDPLIVASLTKDRAIERQAKWSHSAAAASDWGPNRSTGTMLGGASNKALARWIVEVVAAGVTVKGIDFETGTDMTAIAQQAQ